MASVTSCSVSLAAGFSPLILRAWRGGPIVAFGDLSLCGSAIRAFSPRRGHIPDEIARRRLVRVTRGEIQALVDRLGAAPKRLSSSRISSIVNAIRSLYRWAKDHELADFDPAQEIRLPAGDAKPRDRIVTPAEFARLIEAIFETTPSEREEGKTRDRDAARKDALPFALAGYGGARHQEIQVLDSSRRAGARSQAS